MAKNKFIKIKQMTSKFEKNIKIQMKKKDRF